MSSNVKEKMNKLPRIVAVDFDGTIVSDAYPAIGEPNPEMIALCKQLKAAGVKLILWTSRDNETQERALDKAVAFCKDVCNLEFDAVNDNLPEVIECFHNNTRKVYADLYIDDKSIPAIMSPGFWAERIGLCYTLERGVHSAV